MNKKKNLYNILVGLISQILIVVLGIIIPRLFIKNYGSDTNGLTSTITQIFTYLALLEAGIASTTSLALYPYISMSGYDKDGISDVMTVSKKYYRKVSILYFCIVVVFAFLLPNFLKTSVGYWTIFFYVIFEGLSNVILFYFIENWSTLLLTDGKGYVNKLIDLFVKLSCYAIKIILAILHYNIALIQLGYFCVSLVKLLLYSNYMKKYYGWVNYDVEKPKTKLEGKNSFLISQIASLIFNSTDMIVLSVFCSTALSSVYAVYLLIYSSINGIIHSMFQGMIYILGEKFHHASRSEYIKIHDALTSLLLMSTSIMICVAYRLTIPFIQLYTRNIADINYIYKLMPLMFALIYMLQWSFHVNANLLYLDGHVNIVSRTYLGIAIVNILLSLVLVNKYSILGVLFATMITLPIQATYIHLFADRKVLKRSIVPNFKTIIANFVIFFLCVYINERTPLYFENYFDFIKWGVVLCAIYGLICALINILINRELRLFIRNIIRCKKERR